MKWNKWNWLSCRLAGQRQRQQIINEINSLFSLKEKLIDWIDWICLAKAGCSLLFFINQSTSTKKLVELFDLMERKERESSRGSKPAINNHQFHFFKKKWMIGLLTAAAALRGNVFISFNTFPWAAPPQRQRQAIHSSHSEEKNGIAFVFSLLSRRP